MEDSLLQSPGASWGSVGRPPPGAAGSVKDHSTMLSNAVRIERLSDDEDVDITDDLDDNPTLLSSQGEPVEQGPSEDAAVQSVEPLPAPSPRPSCSVELFPEAASEVVVEGVTHAHCDPASVEETDPQPVGPSSADGGSASEQEDSCGAGDLGLYLLFTSRIKMSRRPPLPGHGLSCLLCCCPSFPQAQQRAARAWMRSMRRRTRRRKS